LRGEVDASDRRSAEAQGSCAAAISELAAVREQLSGVKAGVVVEHVFSDSLTPGCVAVAHRDAERLQAGLEHARTRAQATEGLATQLVDQRAAMTRLEIERDGASDRDATCSG
jgi:hypothetical protein